LIHDAYNGPGCQSVSNSKTQVGDAKQRKRERERARYAKQRNELNRKHREKYQIKNQETTLTGGSRGDTTIKFNPINVHYPLALIYGVIIIL